MTLASFGKMPTTRLRRLISLLIRSSGFVDQILIPWLPWIERVVRVQVPPRAPVDVDQVKVPFTSDFTRTS